MFTQHLRCYDCHEVYSLDELYKCAACGGTLDVVYDMDALRADGRGKEAILRHGGSLWRFRELLPVGLDVSPVTMGEGSSPLIETTALHHDLGLENLWLKNETSNPTGSFKDRPISVAITKAVELGIQGVVTSSSGNAGAAVAAYAARAGIPAVIFVPEGLPQARLLQIVGYGARMVAVRGTVAQAYRLAGEFAAMSGWYNVTTTCLSAFPTEGNKTVAYELYTQFQGDVPDWVLVPVGAGPLLIGIWKGFRELVALGMTDRVPRMVAVQASGCAPIARAFERGEDRVVAWGSPKTIASGIADPLHGYEDDGTLTLGAVRESRGAVIDVSDEAILQARGALARREGILAEPTGAAAVAGVERLLARGLVRSSERVVCLVTGHGLKDLGDPPEALKQVEVIDGHTEALRSLMADLSATISWDTEGARGCHACGSV